MPDASPLAVNVAAIDRLRACAAAVRASADVVERAMRDLPAYDRPDVWQGGRATEFRVGLEQQQRALASPDLGAVGRLRDAAQRIERRADALQTS